MFNLSTCLSSITTMHLIDIITAWLQPIPIGESCFRAIRNAIRSYIGDTLPTYTDPEEYWKDDMHIILSHFTITIRIVHPDGIDACMEIEWSNTDGELLTYEEFAPDFENPHNKEICTVSESVDNPSSDTYQLFFRKLLRC